MGVAVGYGMSALGHKRTFRPAVSHGWSTKRGIQYVEHTEGDGVEMFKAVCKLGLEEGMVSKKLNAPYESGHQRRG
jgi:ATP-dependent DNA ligase